MAELTLLALPVANTTAEKMRLLKAAPPPWHSVPDLWVPKLQRLCLASVLRAQPTWRLCSTWGPSGYPLMSHRPSSAYKTPIKSHATSSLQISIPSHWVLPAFPIFSAESPYSKLWNKPCTGALCQGAQNLPAKMEAYKPQTLGVDCTVLF